MSIGFDAVGILLGAILKFAVLSSAVRFFVQAPPKMVQAMQVPQLITALTGGAIALVVASALKKTGALKKPSNLTGGWISTRLFLLRFYNILVGK